MAKSVRYEHYGGLTEAKSEVFYGKALDHKKIDDEDAARGTG